MKKEWNIFDNPTNVRIMLIAFYILLGVLMLSDFFIDKHGYFPWENAPQFYAAYGFVSCVAVITIAKILRFFLKRGEDYYD